MSRTRGPHASLSRLASAIVVLLSLASPAKAADRTCLFTPEELGRVIGQPLLAPLVQQRKPPERAYCTFEAANDRGKKLIVASRSPEERRYFEALQRLAKMTAKDKFQPLPDVGKAAFLTPGAFRAWDGTRSLHVYGLRGILKREITPAEATGLLRLGLERMPH